MDHLFNGQTNATNIVENMKNNMMMNTAMMMIVTPLITAFCTKLVEILLLVKTKDGLLQTDTLFKPTIIIFLL
jgi:hypothetical protein